MENVIKKKVDLANWGLDLRKCCAPSTAKTMSLCRTF